MSVCMSITFWFLLLTFLNNLSTILIFCINVGVEKLLLLDNKSSAKRCIIRRGNVAHKLAPV